MLTWTQLQQEHRPWADHNFGERKPWQPLFGMVEEWGELGIALANEANFETEVEDACADLMIFTLDFCNTQGWTLSEVLSEGKNFLCSVDIGVAILNEVDQSYAKIGFHLSKIQHHFLKRSQRIRGAHHEHEAKMKFHVSEMTKAAAAVYDSMCTEFGDERDAEQKLLEAVNATWARVKLRDFTKNSKTGGEEG